MEHAIRADVGQCDQAQELCKARAGMKAGPLVVDAKNPLIDNHEFVVVAEKKLLGFSKHDKVMGRIQTRDTVASRTCFTNCGCVGCGISQDNFCKPMFASEARCCCLEAATRVDFSECQKAKDLCEVRAGVKAGPLVVDAKNPIVDNHELVVLAEKRVYGC